MGELEKVEDSLDQGFPTVDIQGQVTLLGCPEYCGVLSSISGPHLLSTRNTPSHDNQKCPQDIAQCLLRVRITFQIRIATLF